MNKKKTTVSYGLLLLAGAVLLTLFDQWTKQLAVQHLQGQNAFVLIPGVFELRYLENTGAAFGILSNQQWFFYIVTVIMAVGIVWLYFKLPMTNYYRPIHIILIFIVSGAAGNFIDRVTNQYVIDFLYFSLIDFPIFNVADIYVTVGVALLLILVLCKYKDSDFDFLSSKKSSK